MNTLLTIFDLERYKHHRGGGFWGDDTVYALARRHAERSPHRVAIRTAVGTLTYADLIRAADAVALELSARGLRPGDRVAVWLPSRAETVIVLLACSRGGFVCCPSLHRDHTVADIVGLLQRMRARVLFAQRSYGADAGTHDIIVASKAVAKLEHVYTLDAPASGRSFDFVAEACAKTDAADAKTSKPAAARDPNHVLYLAFTSGTTGVPKGVMHSDNTLLANARALLSDWNIGSHSVVYSLSPLSHNLGFGAMIMAIAAGAELVLHDLPRAHSLVDRIIGTGTTFLVGVPTHAIDILNEVRERQMSGLGALTGFRISGAAAPGEVVAELLRYGIKPQSGYGMTETCSHQYTLPDDDPKLIVETCGKSCPGYEIRIFDRADPDRPLPPGEVGQIGGRGASLMLGYFDNQESTEDSFNRDGWFMTGDLGWVDENGYLRITGRTKDVIIRGGHNIYPGKIEALAVGCDAIQYAMAVPVADKRLGEKVCLAVMFRPGMRATPDDILHHLNAAGLSKYDMPEYFLEVDDVPLTASGKIRKRDLTDRIAEGRLHPVPVRWQPQAASMKAS
jgi:acyl-CoA synthetase (AMP-forming)/AMP-acid ligase II